MTPPKTKANISIIFLCLLGMSWGVYLLYQDLYGIGNRRGAIVAKVEEIGADVRTKTSNQFIWTKLRPFEHLHRKDSVQTGQNSRALLKLLNNNQLIEMGENSLVILDEGLSSIEFKVGQFVIRSKGATILMNVKKGEPIQRQFLSVSLETPKPFEHFFTENKFKVSFKWGAYPSRLILKLNESAHGKPSVRFIPIRKGKDHYSTTLKKGHYSWQILSLTKNPLTEERHFFVHQVSPLHLTYPTRGILVPSSTFAFRFETEPAGLLNQAELELSDSKNFETVYRKEEISPENGSALMRDVREGISFWRVKSLYPGLTLTSPAESFLVESAPPTIELTKPLDRVALKLSQKIPFRWAPSIDFDEYLIEIKSIDQSLKSISHRTKHTFFDWENPDEGKYTWQVTGFRKNTSTESLKNRVTVTRKEPIVLQTPQHEAILHYWNTFPKFSFLWDHRELPPESALSYRLDLSRDISFKKMLTEVETQSPSLESEKAALRSGVLFWRIRLVDGEGNTVNMSQVNRFSLNLFSTLSAPEKLHSKDLYEIESLNEGPTLSWKLVNDATSYEFILTSSGKMVFQTITRNNELGLSHVLPGHYEWNVRAVDPLSRKGNAGTFQPFKLVLIGPLEKPEIISAKIK